MIKITIIQPGLDSVHYEIEGDEATIGRSGDCDVVVRHPYVSKRHVKIIAGLMVVDMASSNGTFIGDKRITHPTRLVGERIRLGKTEEDVTIDISHEEESLEPGTDAEQALRVERRKVRDLTAEIKGLREQQQQADGTSVRELERANRELRAQLEAARADSDNPTAIEDRLARLEHMLTLTGDELVDGIGKDTLQVSATELSQDSSKVTRDTELDKPDGSLG